MSAAVRKPSLHPLSVATRGLFCVAFLLVAACENKAAFTPPPPPKVTVSQPVQRNVTDYLELTGNTQAFRTVQLTARVEGYLEKVLFRDGDMVKKDQLLFLIQQNTYNSQLQQAEGNVQTQKAVLEHARIEFARYTNLYSHKAASETDVENWRFQRDSAQAALLSAEAQRDLARLNLGYTSVTAPFDGRIDRRLVDPGNLVGSGTPTVLAELRQIDPLYVYFTVSETDISRLIGSVDETQRSGKTSRYPVFVGFANDEGFPHQGHLDFSAASLSTGTGTLLVRAVLRNEGEKTLPGQFARVKVPVGGEVSALLVPKVAVSFDQVGAYVLVVDDKNVVQRRNVKTGASKGEMYVIEDGLTGNESVVVKGLLKALPGRPVTPEREMPEQQPTG